VVTVSGLVWTSVPIAVEIWIDVPDTTVTQLWPNLIRGTMSPTGFSFIMNTAPDDNNYMLNYIAYF